MLEWVILYTGCNLLLGRWYTGIEGIAASLYC
nr:MAG TPA: hypothetical protein [Crassvirales sp.]